MRIPRPSDDAVSPAVATILLVVITVVFLAVAGMILISMSDNVGSAKSVGLIVKPSEAPDRTPRELGPSVAFTITLTGGVDAASLTRFTVAISDPIGNGEPHEKDLQSMGIGTPVLIPLPLDSGYVPDRTGSIRCLVTITGHFADGSSSVLYQNMMTL